MYTIKSLKGLASHVNLLELYVEPYKIKTITIKLNQFVENMHASAMCIHHMFVVKFIESSCSQTTEAAHTKSIDKASLIIFYNIKRPSNNTNFMLMVHNN